MIESTLCMYICNLGFVSSTWKSTIHNGRDANSLVAGSTNILQGFVHWSRLRCSIWRAGAVKIPWKMKNIHRLELCKSW